MPGESRAFFYSIRGPVPRSSFCALQNGDAGTPACRNAMQATVRQRLRFNALINNFIPCQPEFFNLIFR
jgi:hypothetical protein